MICAISTTNQMQWVDGTKPYLMSPDRPNPRRGYVENNLRFVCAELNGDITWTQQYLDEEHIVKNPDGVHSDEVWKKVFNQFIQHFKSKGGKCQYGKFYFPFDGEKIEKAWMPSPERLDNKKSYVDDNGNFDTENVVFICHIFNTSKRHTRQIVKHFYECMNNSSKSTDNSNSNSSNDHH
jgi:hypothetical protein